MIYQYNVSCKSYFNAKVGEGNGEECIGKFGQGEKNERGEELLNFTSAIGLKINSHFQKSSHGKWTWRRPNQWNTQRDWLINRIDVAKDTQVLNGVNVGNDHRMERCKIQVKFQQERNKIFHTKPQPLRAHKNSIHLFQIDLQNRYDALELHQNSDEVNNLSNLYKNILESLIEAAKEHRDVRPDRNNHFSEETRNLIKKRRQLRRPKTAREKVEFAELKKAINRPS